MLDLVLFVNSKSDAEIAANQFSDAGLVRIPLEQAEKLIPVLPGETRLWIDPSLDGYPDPHDDDRWANFMKSEFEWHDKMLDPAFVANPDPKVIKTVADDLAESLAHHKPYAVGVPQLAHQSDVSHNKINRLLAKAFCLAAKREKLGSMLILPAVFTNQKQLNLKTDRDKKLKVIKRCYSDSEARGIWAVDASLADQGGVHNLEGTRFPGVIALHSELAKLPNLELHVAGPYWGLNLVLWCRGEITAPACSAGTRYQYYRPGRRVRRPQQPTDRVAIPALRRWAKATDDFWSWLAAEVSKMQASDPARAELDALLADRERLELTSGHKEQVAEFYHAWVTRLSAVPQSGRALALYQDLSSAHVVASSMKDIPSESGRARFPGIVARQLMLNCL